MSIKLNSVGGGSVTIAEPNTASDFTLSVPAVTGTMLTTASTGTVLQVVQGTFATETASTNNTLIDTGLTATITPTSATSKVLVLVNIAIGKSLSDTYAILKLLRNSTSLCNFHNEAAFTNSSALNSIAAGTNFLDSPATTSATIYKVQFASQANTSKVFICGSNSVATITLMEIAG
jgi:hypothetical protein